MGHPPIYEETGFPSVPEPLRVTKVISRLPPRFVLNISGTIASTLYWSGFHEGPICNPHTIHTSPTH
jgi:hypothetical protein